MGIEIYPGPTPQLQHRHIDVEPRDLTLFLATAAIEKSASDVLAIDIGDVSTFASYFLILTASNTRLLHSLVDELRDRARDEYGLHVRVEGERSEEWVLLDFGSLIVHCFSAEAREFYQLERLWSDAARIELPTPSEIQPH
ncbi:ribosome silencing factor [Ferrimicrobium sp.]|uniref:ribosome silencing factor n=1 Tax=Ferrimicrobium sp. TaxID=2926050 RepID=UPI00260303BD|nr:ribosome silencing factor [Ferrimicrobium sp.]